MNEPRPAMISARPPEIRSTVANSWKTRTGSSELSTLTALVSLIRLVRAAAAASTTAGAETTKSGRWCSPTPKTSSPTCSASSTSSSTSAQPPRRACRPDLGERVDAQFHDDAVSPKTGIAGSHSRTTVSTWETAAPSTRYFARSTSSSPSVSRRRGTSRIRTRRSAARTSASCVARTPRSTRHSTGRGRGTGRTSGSPRPVISAVRAY